LTERLRWTTFRPPSGSEVGRDPRRSGTRRNSGARVRIRARTRPTITPEVDGIRRRRVVRLPDDPHLRGLRRDHHSTARIPARGRGDPSWQRRPHVVRGRSQLLVRRIGAQLRARRQPRLRAVRLHHRLRVPGNDRGRLVRLPDGPDRVDGAPVVRLERETRHAARRDPLHRDHLHRDSRAVPPGHDCSTTVPDRRGHRPVAHRPVGGPG
jgi:hypothetical protein